MMCFVDPVAMDGPSPVVIGHRGAAAVAPANTLAGLQAGVAAGAAAIEFDVGPDLRLAHSAREVPDDAITLDAALEFLRAAGVGIHLDAKLPGYEEALVAAVRRHGVEDRTFVSTAWAVTTRRLELLAPALPRAIGYPRDRYGVSRRLRFAAPLRRVGAGAWGSVMPLRVPLLLARSRATVLSLHHSLCSPHAVAAAHRAGAPVVAWTVNDPSLVRRVAAAGVDAVVTDDPAMAARTLASER